MSFSYESNTWIPRTAAEHAADILNQINAKLTAKEITPLLAANDANPIWIFVLAIAEIRAIKDQELYQASQVLNPAVCEDNQMTDLMPVAGTELIEGAYSTVIITVTATEDGTCTIPLGATLPFIEGITFATMEELIVLAEESGEVKAI